ncbi:unnamed protein product [Ranitomeya imitator]|uniref:Uncharacterized protein n=1 Tax=Ranitomeya imitator TaxID=111125 RepID=A0ABN9LMP0_9NEOB|nr:unnamed protein product [Ranitomeya imitator]
MNYLDFPWGEDHVPEHWHEIVVDNINMEHLETELIIIEGEDKHLVVENREDIVTRLRKARLESSYKSLGGDTHMLSLSLDAAVGYGSYSLSRSVGENVDFSSDGG